MHEMGKKLSDFSGKHFVIKNDSFVRNCILRRILNDFRYYICIHKSQNTCKWTFYGVSNTVNDYNTNMIKNILIINLRDASIYFYIILIIRMYKYDDWIILLPIM